MIHADLCHGAVHKETTVLGAHPLTMILLERFLLHDLCIRKLCRTPQNNWLILRSFPMRKSCSENGSNSMYIAVHTNSAKDDIHLFKQHTATHCNTLQDSARHFKTLQDTMQNTTTLQHTATDCNTLQHIATHYNTLQHTATHCGKLQDTARHCKTLQDTERRCQTLHGTARHCKTLQDIARHWLYTLTQQKTKYICSAMMMIAFIITLGEIM